MTGKKKMKRYYGPAIYKVREVTEPYSGQYKCYRLLIAIPNMAGTKPYTSEPAPSFRPGYLLYQSSDFHIENRDHVVTTILKMYERAGYSPMEDVETFQTRMEILMIPIQTDHIPREDL